MNLVEIIGRRIIQVRIAQVQRGAHSVLGGNALVDAVEDSLQIAWAGGFDRLHHGERPFVSNACEARLQIEPGWLKNRKRRVLMLVVEVEKFGGCSLRLCVCPPSIAQCPPEAKWGSGRAFFP